MRLDHICRRAVKHLAAALLHEPHFAQFYATGRRQFHSAKAVDAVFASLAADSDASHDNTEREASTFRASSALAIRSEDGDYEDEDVDAVLGELTHTSKKRTKEQAKEYTFRHIILPSLQHFFDTHQHMCVPISYKVPKDGPPECVGFKLGMRVDNIRFRGDFVRKNRKRLEALETLCNGAFVWDADDFCFYKVSAPAHLCNVKREISYSSTIHPQAVYTMHSF